VVAEEDASSQLRLMVRSISKYSITFQRTAELGSAFLILHSDSANVNT